METVLLLNASYEPLRVINWKRALTLLFSGKVEVLEEYEREVCSVSLSIRMPSVIRLHALIRVKTRGVKFSRQNIYARDKYECQYCRRRLPPSELTYDHVVPHSTVAITVTNNDCLLLVLLPFINLPCLTGHHHGKIFAPDRSTLPSVASHGRCDPGHDTGGIVELSRQFRIYMTELSGAMAAQTEKGKR